MGFKVENNSNYSTIRCNSEKLDALIAPELKSLFLHHSNNGVNTFIMIPESLLSLIIGCLLLVLIWVGNFKLPIGSSKVFVLVGAVHSFVATIFGVGAFLQPAILRTELVKLQVTGTLAACMLSMDIFKIIGFSSSVCIFSLLVTK